MCLFVILTSEGWVEVVEDTLMHVSNELAPFVALLFVVYHMFMYGVSKKSLCCYGNRETKK